MTPVAPPTPRRGPALASGIAAALLALACLATVTAWIPLRGEKTVVASKLSALGAVGTQSVAERPGSGYLLPFERLVAPFLLVPSGDDGAGQGFVEVRKGSVALREARDLETWNRGADAAFLDGDRIGGDGIVVYLPPGFLAPGEGLTIAYRAAATPGAIAALWMLAAIAFVAWLVDRRLRALPRRERARRVAAAAMGAAGACLLGLNVAGLWIEARPSSLQPLLAGRASGSGDGAWLDGEGIAREVRARPGEGREDFAVRMNDLVANNVVPVWNHAHVAALRLHVPPWSNYLLWGLGEIDPSVYRYHYIAWRPALERGAGMCAQYTLILVDLLRERGYDARIAQLSGHTVVTAEVSPGTWYVFDPYVGVTIPRALPAIEVDPPSVQPIYQRRYERLKHPEPAFAARVMAGLYDREGNHIEARGANQMMGEGWMWRERLADWLKWLIPAGLLAAAVWLARKGRPGRKSPI